MDIYFYLFAAEIFISIVLITGIVFHRFNSNFFIRKKRRRKEILSAYISSLIEKKEPLDCPNYPGKSYWKNDLLKALESFDSLIRGEEWNLIKKELIFQFLIKRARTVPFSIFWKKRNFAARVFALYPFKEDEQIIMYLTNDPEFTVRGHAQLASIRLGSEGGVHKALYAISENHGYVHYFYQDLLLLYPDRVFAKIIEFAKDPDLHIACLRVLQFHAWSHPIPFLEEDLQSKDPLVRYLALNILRQNLIPNSEEYFAKGLHDSNEQIILASIRGILQFSVAPYKERLKSLLNSLSWQIRLASARALLSLGDEGRALVAAEKSPLAKQVQSYVEVFP